jgi:hypothetical protein
VVPLGPAQVHPQQHRGEIRRVDPTGLGSDGDQGVALVVLPGEQRAHLESIDDLLQGHQFGFGLGQTGGVLLFLAELDQQGQVIEAGPEADDPVDVGLQRGQPRRHPLGPVGIVPQVRRGGLALQLGDLGALALGVDDGLDRAQCLVELGQHCGKVGSSHKESV